MKTGDVMKNDSYSLDKSIKFLLMIAVCVIFLLFGLAYWYLHLSGDNCQSATTENQIDGVSIHNINNKISYLEIVDLNDDGIDEGIFRLTSMSWISEIRILNDELLPLCDKCDFLVRNGGLEYVDLDNDKVFELIITNEVEYTNEVEEIFSERSTYWWVNDNYEKR